jgi:hypothetical protein
MLTIIPQGENVSARLRNPFSGTTAALLPEADSYIWGSWKFLLPNLLQVGKIKTYGIEGW